MRAILDGILARSRGSKDRATRSEQKPTKGEYSPVWRVMLVISLLFGARAVLALNLSAFENRKYTAYDLFHENSPYADIPTKKVPIKNSNLPQDHFAI